MILRIMLKKIKDLEVCFLYLLQNRFIKSYTIFYCVENIYFYKKNICKEKVFIIFIEITIKDKATVLNYLTLTFKTYFIYY